MCVCVCVYRKNVKLQSSYSLGLGKKPQNLDKHE